MLTVNLSVRFCLLNGALGIVEDIIYLNGRKPPALPDVVMVNIPNYNGPPFFTPVPQYFLVFLLNGKLNCICHFCKRKQLPLRLGWATTIHRCQGMTIGDREVNRYIVINPGTRALKSRNPGALFRALSRAKSTGKNINDPDFAWHPSFLVNDARICHCVNTPTTTERNMDILRIESIAKKTKQKTASAFRHLSEEPNLKNLLHILLNTTEEYCFLSL